MSAHRRIFSLRISSSSKKLQMLSLMRRLIGAVNTSEQLQGITLHVLPQGILILFRKIFSTFKESSECANKYPYKPASHNTAPK